MWIRQQTPGAPSSSVSSQASSCLILQQRTPFPSSSYQELFLIVWQQCFMDDALWLYVASLKESRIFPRPSEMRSVLKANPNICILGGKGTDHTKPINLWTNQILFITVANSIYLTVHSYMKSAKDSMYYFTFYGQIYYTEHWRIVSESQLRSANKKIKNWLAETSY